MSDTLDTTTFRSILKSQYHAGLAMLKESIDKCPETLWLDAQPRNAFWQIAYHALFFTHLYLQREESDFRPWAEHQSATQNPDGIAGPPEPGNALPLIPQPYSRTQVLAYWDICNDRVDGWVDALDLRSPNSGFPWYKTSKLEHQMISLRHLQHHTAQLADRLRAALDIGVRWIGARP